jgi:DNA repair exonuclease SbcCD nuclease subunit
MARPLNEIQEMADVYRCPVLVAGDIIDSWNAPAELLNWVYLTTQGMLQDIITIPGQHDLPYHSTNEIGRSAYFTLHHMGVIKALLDGVGTQIATGVRVWTFPFGRRIRSPIHGVDKRELNIALIHDYVWTEGHKFPKAPKGKNISRIAAKHNMCGNKLFGYDVIVYGDNHKGFLKKIGKTTVFNCGTLMRRKSDEIDYRPQVGLLYGDGSVERHYLDVSADRYIPVEEARVIENKREQELDMTRLSKELRTMSITALDFVVVMEQIWEAEKVSNGVRRIIQKAMEK